MTTNHNSACTNPKDTSLSHSTENDSNFKGEAQQDEEDVNDTYNMALIDADWLCIVMVHCGIKPATWIDLGDHIPALVEMCHIMGQNELQYQPLYLHEYLIYRHDNVMMQTLLREFKEQWDRDPKEDHSNVNTGSYPVHDSNVNVSPQGGDGESREHCYCCCTVMRQHHKNWIGRALGYLVPFPAIVQEQQTLFHKRRGVQWFISWPQMNLTHAYVMGQAIPGEECDWEQLRSLLAQWNHCTRHLGIIHCFEVDTCAHAFCDDEEQTAQVYLVTQEAVTKITSPMRAYWLNMSDTI